MSDEELLEARKESEALAFDKGEDNNELQLSGDMYASHKSGISETSMLVENPLDTSVRTDGLYDS